MTQHTNKRDLNARLRMDQALKLRLAGSDYNAIARACGYSHRSSARKAVLRAMAEIPKESAEHMRELEGQRLDYLLMRWWLRAEKDVYALREVRGIIEQRIKLFGLSIEPADATQPKTIIREIPAYLGLIAAPDEQQEQAE